MAVKGLVRLKCLCLCARCQCHPPAVAVAVQSERVLQLHVSNYSGVGEKIGAGAVISNDFVGRTRRADGRQIVGTTDERGFLLALPGLPSPPGLQCDSCSLRATLIEVRSDNRQNLAPQEGYYNLGLAGI